MQHTASWHKLGKLAGLALCGSAASLAANLLRLLLPAADPVSQVSPATERVLLGLIYSTAGLGVAFSLVCAVPALRGRHAWTLSWGGIAGFGLGVLLSPWSIWNLVVFVSCLAIAVAPAKRLWWVLFGGLLMAIPLNAAMTVIEAVVMMAFGVSSQILRDHPQLAQIAKAAVFLYLFNMGVLLGFWNDL